MKCPRCAAENPPGALACAYCAAVLASADDLGDGARALDARFDELSSTVARLLTRQRVPEVTAKTLHVGLAAVGENVARMRDVLEASARAIPRPATPQEAMVWIRRAPALVWVSYRALGHTRNFTIAYLYEVLASLYRERAAWESRDKGLAPVFAEGERVVREAAPTALHGAMRFARTNPLLAAVLALLTVSAVWSMAGGASHGGHGHRTRRHAEATSPSHLVRAQA
jgi:hypothetical protein